MESYEEYLNDKISNIMISDSEFFIDLDFYINKLIISTISFKLS